MADRTPLKTADRNAISSDAISDDDPFAELTRIMGFDPREPVKSQAAPDPVMGDDFDIDLEKELMGEFSMEADAGHDAAQAPEPAAEPVYDAHELDMDDLDDAVAVSMQDFAPDAAYAAEPELEELDMYPEPDPELDMDPDFGEAVAQSFQVEAEPDTHSPTQDPAAEDEFAPAPIVAADQDFDAQFAEALADVDMDFDARAELVVHAPEVVAAEPEYQAAEATSFEDEAEAEIEAWQEPEPTVSVAAPAEDRFVVQAAQEPEAAAEIAEALAPAAQERSLEDELNALLGNMGARVAKSTTEGTTMSRSWASMSSMAGSSIAGASHSGATDPFAVAAAGYGASQPVETPHVPDNLQEHDGGADLDAMLLQELANSDMTDQEEHSAAAEQPFTPQETPAMPLAWNVQTPVTAEPPAAPAWQAEPEAEPVLDEQPAAASFNEMPDVETIDVPERVVALADDLDIPELAFEQDRPASASFDDLDVEFAGMLGDLNAAEAEPVPSRAAAYDDEPYQAGFSRGDSRAYAASSPAPAPAFAAEPYNAAASYNAATVQMDSGFGAPHDGRPFAPAEAFAPDGLDYDPELDHEMAIPGMAAAEMASAPRRRGLFIAAAVGAVAIVGGIGAFALSPGGSSGSDVPVIVKADNTPIKVKPENPGGTVVPNQDNKVYEVVAKGGQPEAPSQEKLVAAAQDPVDVNAAAPQNRVIDLSSTPDETADASGDTAPTAKSEDRIVQDAQPESSATTNQDVALVTPRKVRTMIVKPDGTLAPREDPTPAPAIEASEPMDPAPQRVASAPVQADDLTGTIAANDETASAVPESGSALKPVAKADTQSATTPATVAAAPQRPSEQPVNIVGEVKPDQVASISPTAAASGSWSMQIASQPNEESAQASYKALASRYASVLDGHQANIVKAEIAGKGTFYRVRIPANSRNDAITLCESYKAAGGNCFVSK
ncbi:SPOR domain-containing protein [Mesorhizobium sp. A623]